MGNKNGDSNKITIYDTTGNKFGLADHLACKKNEKIELSLVVPSYNEEERLPIMLDETVAYLQAHGIVYEIIVVNDGSKDKTS